MEPQFSCRPACNPFRFLSQLCCPSKCYISARSIDKSEYSDTVEGVMELLASFEINCRNISFIVPSSVTFGVIYRMRKISMPETSGSDRWDQNKDLLSRNISRRCVLAGLWTVKLGLTKDGNQAILLTYSEKSCISLQFRADIQTCGPTSIHSRQRRSRD
jgi:hypothetical protein